MNKYISLTTLLLTVLLSSLFAQAPHNAMGEKAGEVDQHSAILMTRLTQVPERDSVGNVPGAEGWVAFELSAYDDFSHSRFTSWRQARPGNDYTVKMEIGGLAADTRYFYRVIIGEAMGHSDRVGPRRSFRTAPEPEITRDVAFTVVTSHLYAAVDHPDGFESYAAMLRLRPDFIIPTGDNVYYDRDTPPGVDIQSCRWLWHRMFSLPRLVEFYGRTASYWEKDDHDYRLDDADPYMDRPNPYYRDSIVPVVDDATGRMLFIEQAPVREKTYRSFRWGSALQIWLTEGRDFRTPNDMPDGPGKTMWGVEQRRWLKKGILESDAMFKILISPTALLGPDRADKLDSHANRAGFYTEGQNFLHWLADNDVKNFYIACGDRHWKYHSVHKETGYEEFCCGALGDGSSVKNPQYENPDVERKFYLGNGGFLLVRVLAEDREQPELVFDFYEKDGTAVHSVRRAYQAD